MTVERGELIGHWSVEHGYHSSMEDEWLMFREDGSGWYAYLRPWYSSVVVIRWLWIRPGIVRVESRREIEVDEAEGNARLERRYIDVSEEVAYAVTLVRRPLVDEPVRELRIGLSHCLGGAFAWVGLDEPERDFLHAADVRP
ncbi:hypothetical protein AB0M43_19275 [Longispora sp. NPDC051575]|uniref:hypothetical protein n=1 Tax=Longispora sp. NPDC051575 TaxID=3154943 RepID=UPI003413B32D